MIIPSVSNVIDRPIPTFLGLDDVRMQINLYGDTSQDSYLQMLASLAQEQVEDYIGQYLQVTQSQLYFKYFDTSGMALSQPNVSNVIVKYWDVNDVLQTLTPSTYFVDTTANPVLLKPVLNATFPAGLSSTRKNPVQVTYDSILFGAQADMDIERVRHAMMMIVTHWYNSRDNNDVTQKPEVQYGFLRLLNKYRLPTL